MMTEHGNLCDATEALYCMHGGTCYRIPSMSVLTCVCPGSYKGSRCEEFQLFSSSQGSRDGGLIAAMVIVVILIVVVLSVVIYLVYKMWRKQTQPAERSNEYWRVKPRT